jgi:2-dehydro-3-deoxy-D-gluconate 5-dehydrogenase
LTLGLAKAGTAIVGVSVTPAFISRKIEREITALGRTFKEYQCDFESMRIKKLESTIVMVSR